jgi:endonuclease/exonuclease/phosphatase family metal-dependent hydrolase
MRTRRLGIALLVLLESVGACSERAKVSQTTPGPGAAQSERPLALRVLTWNVFLMPRITFQSPKNSARAAAIADALLERNDDILCLEKVFDGHARRVLAKRLRDRFPFQYGPANNGFSLKANSGVWVASRLPLSGYHEIQFRAAAGIERLSRKGALLLSGTFQSHLFQLIATHLQGEETPYFTEAHQAVRNAQMRQIRDELITPFVNVDVPLIIAGDLITPRRDENDPARPESASYKAMLDVFAATNGVADRFTLDDEPSHNDMARDKTGRLVELDYILVSDHGVPLAVDRTLVILRRQGWDGPSGRKDLGYRYAVEASIQFLR